MEDRSPRYQNRRRGSYHSWSIISVLAFSVGCLSPTASNAYTAAGDRNFPAQLILPQIAPTDALCVPLRTLPMEALKPTDPTRQTNFTGTYSKLITEELGIQLDDGLIRRDLAPRSSVTGAPNFSAMLQYETIFDPPH